MDNLNEFEVAQLSRVQYPDDWHEWPEDHARAAQFAVDRLLKRAPEARVISDTSFCMLPDHPRYPTEQREWNKGAFYLVRTVGLDRPVPEA